MKIPENISTEVLFNQLTSQLKTGNVLVDSKLDILNKRDIQGSFLGRLIQYLKDVFSSEKSVRINSVAMATLKYTQERKAFTKKDRESVVQFLTVLSTKTHAYKKEVQEIINYLNLRGSLKERDASTQSKKVTFKDKLEETLKTKHGKGKEKELSLPRNDVLTVNESRTNKGNFKDKLEESLKKKPEHVKEKELSSPRKDVLTGNESRTNKGNFKHKLEESLKKKPEHGKENEISSSKANAHPGEKEIVDDKSKEHVNNQQESPKAKLISEKEAFSLHKHSNGTTLKNSEAKPAEKTKEATVEVTQGQAAYFPIISDHPIKSNSPVLLSQTLMVQTLDREIEKMSRSLPKIKKSFEKMQMEDKKENHLALWYIKSAKVSKFKEFVETSNAVFKVKIPKFKNLSYETLPEAYYHAYQILKPKLEELKNKKWTKEEIGALPVQKLQSTQHFHDLIQAILLCQPD